MSDYASQFSYWESFNQQKKQNNFVSLGKIFLKIGKWFALFSMVVIFFWGLGTLFFGKDIKTGEVEILNAQGETLKKTYLNGVFFELTTGYKEELTFKNHIFHLVDNEIYEYDYRSASDAKEMWNYSTSPFYVLLVLPTSWVMNKLAFVLSWSRNSLGADKNLMVIIFTIFFTSLILRIITSFGTWKQQKNQIKMKTIQAKVAAIKDKYSDQTAPESKQKMQWEIMSLYRKEKINPLGSALEGFAFAPFLFAMFVVVRVSRILKDSSTANFSFTANIWGEITTYGAAIYLVPVAFYFLFFIFDNFLLTRYIEKKTTKKAINPKPQKFSQKLFKWGFKILFIVFFFIVPVGTSIYWIFSSFFEILQKSFFFKAEQIRKKQAVLKKQGKEVKWWNI